MLPNSNYYMQIIQWLYGWIINAGREWVWWRVFLATSEMTVIKCPHGIKLIEESRLGRNKKNVFCYFAKHEMMGIN